VADWEALGDKFCFALYEMHFMWKEIRKELRVTNGWLKPRKLNEITGTPAAQILNDEIQKKRREEQKRKAILEYEQFLKKYFMPIKPPQQHLRRQPKTSFFPPKAPPLNSSNA